MKKIGVLGGMGPASTAFFYQKIIEIAQKKYGAVQDTDYPPVFIYSCPLEGFDETGIVDEKLVLHQLIAAVEILNQAGVSFIVIPCNTVHYYIDKLRKHSKVPILSIVEETVKKIKSEKLSCVGLICSESAHEHNLYGSLAKNGVKVVVDENDEHVTALILDVMKGNILKKHKNKVLSLIKKLGLKSQAVVLGCTELPLAVKQSDTKIKLFDTVEILAEASLLHFQADNIT